MLHLLQEQVVVAAVGQVLQELLVHVELAVQEVEVLEEEIMVLLELQIKAVAVEAV
tara:strand:- start:91 stop:258 length:168 start_codon:yes stop_codon:yes gene_type:complete